MSRVHLNVQRRGEKKGGTATCRSRVCDLTAQMAFCAEFASSVCVDGGFWVFSSNSLKTHILWIRLMEHSNSLALTRL